MVNRILMLLVLCGATHAETLANLRTRIDNWLADRWTIATNRQEQFYVKHGIYWQGLLIPSIVPSHDASTTGDATPSTNDLARVPTDIASTNTWANCFTNLNVSLPASLRFDVYDGPMGKGWMAIIVVKYGTNTYSRSKDGPGHKPDGTYVPGGLVEANTKAWYLVTQPNIQ